MATDATEICNLALLKMGQSTIDDAVTPGSSVLEVKCNLLYEQCRDELLVEGPQLGWKFATRRYNEIDDERFTIISIAESSTSGDITVTATHTLQVGDLVELDGDTGYDGEYEVTAISTTETFDVTATFVATGTGYAYWRSGEYSYRYLIPSSPTVLRISSVQVGGVEITDWIREGDYILTNEESDEISLTIVQQITDTTKFPPWFTRLLVLKLAIELHYNLTQDLRAIQLLGQEYDLAWSKAVAMDEREKYVAESDTSWVDAGNVNDNII